MMMMYLHHTCCIRSIKPLFLAVRNPDVGKLLKTMRKDLSKDVTAFVHEHSTIFLPDEPFLKQDDTSTPSSSSSGMYKHAAERCQPMILIQLQVSLKQEYPSLQ